MLKMKIPKFPKIPKVPKIPKIPTKILTAMGSYSFSQPLAVHHRGRGQLPDRLGRVQGSGHQKFQR